SVCHWLHQGNPDAGLRRVHGQDPRGPRPARRRQVPPRARGAQQGSHRRSTPEPRAGDGGGAMRLPLILVLLAGCGAHTGTRQGAGRGVTAKEKHDPVKPNARRDFEAAMRAVRLGGPDADDAARGRLRSALKADGNIWEAWYDLGAIAWREGD